MQNPILQTPSLNTRRTIPLLRNSQFILLCIKFNSNFSLPPIFSFTVDRSVQNNGMISIGYWGFVSDGHGFTVLAVEGYGSAEVFADFSFGPAEADVGEVAFHVGGVFFEGGPGAVEDWGGWHFLIYW